MNERVVIVRLSAIGDIVHAIPAAVAIKRARPASEIAWVVEGRAGDVLDGHPAVDRIIRVPRGWLLSAAAVRRLAGELADYRADIAIDLQGLFKSAVATWLSNAPIRIGASRPHARELAWLASTRRVSPRRPHIIERHLELLAPIGIAAPRVEFAMPRHEAARQSVASWFPRAAAGTAVLNPGAGWASKLWPTERFAAVARGLRNRHGVASLVVWGGPDESAAADRIVAGADGAATKAPPTSLGELAEMARLSRLFISSDTGPLHIAAAVGTPCVGLFGPVPASRNGPWGSIHATVEPPAEMRPPWPRRKTDTRSMVAIEADEVLTAAGRLLGRST